MRDITRRIGSAILFPTDHPISTEEMIGREDDVDGVATALLGGGNVVLAGPRRTGKTTVADAAIGICAREGAYVAAVDLFEAPDAATLAYRLSIELLSNRPPLKRAIGDATRAGRSVLGALRTTAAYRAREDLGTDLEITLELAPADRDPTRVLATALALPQRLASSDDRQVVVFFDEFQDIAAKRFGDPDTLTRQLRSVLQRSPRVSVLFAGSIEHLMRDLFAPTDRALSQFGSFHELAAITPEQWTDGLRRRLALDRTTIADDALAYMIELGEGHPRATMLLAQQAHMASIEELRHTIDNAMVVQALDRALGAERLRHEQQIERIRASGRHGERMAIRVAVGAELYAGLRPQQAARALAMLRDSGVIDHGARSGQWFAVDPLLRRYLAARRQ
ncbi:MAG TPA: ATP-binding protein [Solirubrobacteraceae bacterium]|nr:ATP-binding protein [Solirubrobacteraceae bacterium]